MAHYYTTKGEAAHFQPNKSRGGNRPTTIRDARELGLLPGVTTILSVLDKPALTNWMVRQGVMAVCTAPDVPGEGLDAKITRILETEQQQDEESRIARDRGTEIHAAIEGHFVGKPVPQHLREWLNPVLGFFATAFPTFRKPEQIIVGDGYAGKFDLLEEHPIGWRIFDFKSTKKLPDSSKGGAWWEHRLQCAAYAQALKPRTNGAEIATFNVYISTVEPGKFVVCEHGDWQQAWEAFACLRDYWYLANGMTMKPQPRIPVWLTFPALCLYLLALALVEFSHGCANWIK